MQLMKEQSALLIGNWISRSQPYVTLAESSIDWVGRIPAHWQVRRISSCLRSVQAGVWGDDPKDATEPGNIVCVRVADFDMPNLQVTSRKLTVRNIPENLKRSRTLEYGDILIEKSGGGDAQPIGRAVEFTLNQPAVCSNFISRLIVDRSVIQPKYLLFVLNLLQVTRRNVPSIKQTTGIQNLDQRHYFSNPIPVPPLDEQLEIIGAVEKQLETNRGVQKAVEREICLLREYRTDLISEIVMGKLDLRGVDLTEIRAGEQIAQIDDPEGDEDLVTVQENDDAGN
jgi:type I restriction enzyme, S subunit